MLDEASRGMFERVFPQFHSQMPGAALKRVLDNCTLMKFRVGSNIFRDRMPTDGIYFVLSGEADVVIEKDERAVNVAKIGPGQLLGEVSVLSGQRVASSTVTATTPVSTLKLNHQQLDNLLNAEDSGPALIELLSHILVARLRPA